VGRAKANTSTQKANSSLKILLRTVYAPRAAASLRSDGPPVGPGLCGFSESPSTGRVGNVKKGSEVELN